MPNDTLARAVGLLIIEARNSNPNGDPDQDSDPRNRSHDRKGVISGVSFKRKLRDLVEDKDGPVWEAAAARIGLSQADWQGFGILESRGRDRSAIGKLAQAGKLAEAYWDARVFGATFLEKASGDGGGKGDYIRGGVVQFGLGLSVAPVEIERQTRTNKAGVEGDKDRGMAPLAFRVVEHGVYAMPFFVNPTAAKKTLCTPQDIELLKLLIAPAYPSTASDLRPSVTVRHAWYAEHKSALGSFDDLDLLDAMMPKRKGDPNTPSTSWSDYEVPSDPGEMRGRMASFSDLCDMG